MIQKKGPIQLGRPQLWWLGCIASALVHLGGPRAVAQDLQVTVELSEEQSDIKAILQDVGRRMQHLAKKIEPSQPDDARRMREAADRIQSSDLNRIFDDIGSLLGSAQFIEALGHQGRAIDELDAIIKLLERAKFESEEVDQRLRDLEKLRQEAEKLAGSQDKLLRKTRQHLEREKALEQLKSLKKAVSELEENQTQLNQGTDPEKLDPGATRADAKALQQALQLTKELREGQEKINKNVGGLPSEETSLEEVRALVRQLDDLIARAGELQAGTQGAQELAGKISSPEDAGAQGREDAGAQGREDAGAQGSEGAGEKEKDAGAQGSAGAGEKEKGAQQGAQDQESSGTKGADAEKTASKGKKGPSDVEMARRKQALAEARKELEEKARDLSGKLTDLEKNLGAESESGGIGKPDTVKEKVSTSAKHAQKALEELREGELDRALESESRALDSLKKARDQLAGNLGSMEERNAGETSGLVQEQGLLDQKTREGSAKMAQASQQSSSDASSKSLSEGAQALKEAASAMEKAARALQKGDRSGARAAGDKASKDLARAQAGLEKGQNQLAERSAADKSRDLQKKLARKAEQTRKEVEELQKKLRKKQRKKDGENLSGAEKALSGAAKAMRSAADAGQRGEKSLAKKKADEALDRLEEAAADLEKEEREELARLEKDKLKKNAPEQEKLARLTKELAKKASRSGGKSSSGSEQAAGLDDASSSMEKAGEDLQNEDAESAEKEQEKALAKLKNAKEGIKEEEERLARLKREQEMLSMMAELTEITEGQEKINTETVALHAGRDRKESRRQKLRVRQKVEKVVTQEEDLADKVDELNDKIQEELARVFNFILTGVSADMRQVRDSLKELETGSYTQFLQKEIIRDVERLIVALKEELDRQKNNQSPGAQQPQQQGRPRLVPPIAELRMLKTMQVDVNRGTRDLEDLREASPDGVSESWDKALDRLTQKQGSVSRMTTEIFEDFKKATGPEGQGGDSEGESPDDRAEE